MAHELFSEYRLFINLGISWMNSVHLNKIGNIRSDTSVLLGIGTNFEINGKGND